MPPRGIRTPPPAAKPGFYPSNDPSTYRELLRFEERLKTNAALLRRRKQRYQIFLMALVFIMVIATTDFVLDSALLISPLNITLRYAPPPHTYGIQLPLHLHPYIAPGTCLVSAMTLFMFYASGMYSEKIGFANQYVLHANHTLRSFNMHLNVRPKRSSLLSYIFPMLRSPPTVPPPPSPSTPLSRRSSQKENQKDISAAPKRAAQITPIPPPSNPRGELIFSSRVDRSFRESYERYRAAYERKREEKLREASGGGYWSWFLMKKRRTLQQTSGKDKEKDGEKTPGRGRASRTPTQSRSNTPHNSRRPSPAGSTASTGSHRRRSGIVDPLLESVPEKQLLQAGSKPPPTPMDVTDGEGGDSATPTPSQLRQRLDRGRTESFSFLLGRPSIVMPDDGA